MIADVRDLCGRELRRQYPSLNFIVAGPPCEEFSRHSMPWTRKRNPPPPDLSIVAACHRIRDEAEAPMLLENVRAAQKWLGKAAMHYGPHYFWGDIPALYPTQYFKKKKESFGGKERHLRARVPIEFSRWLATLIPVDGSDPKEWNR